MYQSSGLARVRAATNLRLPVSYDGQRTLVIGGWPGCEARTANVPRIGRLAPRCAPRAHARAAAGRRVETERVSQGERRGARYVCHPTNRCSTAWIEFSRAVVDKSDSVWTGGNDIHKLARLPVMMTFMSGKTAQLVWTHRPQSRVWQDS